MVFGTTSGAASEVALEAASGTAFESAAVVPVGEGFGADSDVAFGGADSDLALGAAGAFGVASVSAFEGVLETGV